MIKNILIAPHSPLLLSTSHEKSWQDLGSLSDKNILSIAPHPAFERSSVSIYIEQNYQITFPQFGDLKTKESRSVNHNLFTFLREKQTSVVIEPLTDPVLDYGHAIPLLNLGDKFNYLCLNSTNTTDEFYTWLIENLESYDKDLTLLISGDMFASADASKSNEIKKLNKLLRHNISTKNFSLDYPTNQPDIQNACLLEMIPFLRILFKDRTCEWQEISYNEVNETSFLFGAYVC